MKLLLPILLLLTACKAKVEISSRPAEPQSGYAQETIPDAQTGTTITNPEPPTYDDIDDDVAPPHVWHDDKHAVTCWIVFGNREKSISCLPDRHVEAAGQP